MLQFNHTLLNEKVEIFRLPLLTGGWHLFLGRLLSMPHDALIGSHPLMDDVHHFL
jgi:hypothetical protein